MCLAANADDTFVAVCELATILIVTLYSMKLPIKLEWKVGRKRSLTALQAFMNILHTCIPENVQLRSPNPNTAVVTIHRHWNSS